MATMRAARLHQVGTTFSIDEIAVPKPRPNDVLVKVKACGIIPNMKNVMAHYAEWFPFLPLPPLPAIYGLDASGEVVDVGNQVKSIKTGDRVYVNPGTSCGSCHACRAADQLRCLHISRLFRVRAPFEPGVRRLPLRRLRGVHDGAGFVAGEASRVRVV